MLVEPFRNGVHTYAGQCPIRSGFDTDDEAAQSRAVMQELSNPLFLLKLFTSRAGPCVELLLLPTTAILEYHDSTCHDTRMVCSATHPLHEGFLHPQYWILSALIYYGNDMSFHRPSILKNGRTSSPLETHTLTTPAS